MSAFSTHQMIIAFRIILVLIVLDVLLIAALLWTFVVPSLRRWRNRIIINRREAREFHEELKRRESHRLTGTAVACRCVNCGADFLDISDLARHRCTFTDLH